MQPNTPRAPFLHGLRLRGEAGDYTDALPALHPGARIYVLDEQGITETPYDETEVVELTRSFLADRARFPRHLFA